MTMPPTDRRSTEARSLVALDFIRDHIRRVGYPPSRQEIADAAGLASKDGGQRLIDHLVAKGLIERAPGIPRGIRIVRGVADTEGM